MKREQITEAELDLILDEVGDELRAYFTSFEWFVAEEGPSLWASIVVAGAGRPGVDPDEIWHETLARARGTWPVIRRPRAWCRIVALRLIRGPYKARSGSRYPVELGDLSALSQRERAVLVCCVDGLTGHEIATALDCKIPQVLMLRRRAMRRLGQSDHQVADALTGLAKAFDAAHPSAAEILSRIRDRMDSHPGPELTRMAELQRRLVNEPHLTPGLLAASPALGGALAVGKGPMRRAMLTAATTGFAVVAAPGGRNPWLRLRDTYAFRRYLHHLERMSPPRGRQELLEICSNYLAVSSYLAAEQISTSFSRFLALHDLDPVAASPSTADREAIIGPLTDSPEWPRLAPFLEGETVP